MIEVFRTRSCTGSDAKALSNIDVEQALFLTNELLYRRTGQHLSEVQMAVFREAWLGGRKTYEQLAEEIQYSANYLKQGVGPRLWRLISQAVGQKVSKSTAKAALLNYFSAQPISSNMMEQNESKTPSLVSKKNTIEKTLEQPAGVVPIQSKLYIKRGNNQQLCYHEIDSPGGFLRIKAPRQMGKTSLLSRTLAYSQKQGCKTVLLNFQQAEASVLSDINRLLRWVCANLSLQLELPTTLDNYWDDDLGSKMSCNLFLQSHILQQVSNILIIAFEEVNELLAYPTVAHEFLTLLRFWHERAKVDSHWQNLRLIMVHSTEIYLSLDTNQSPLNVGLGIDLKPFSMQESTALVNRHSLDLKASQIQELFQLTGGHPYLLRIALYHLENQTFSFSEIIRTAATDTGIYHNHLHHKLHYLEQYPEISESFLRVLEAESPTILSQVHGFKLQGLGLVSLNGNTVLVSCQLYQKYFKSRIQKKLRTV